MSIRKSEFIEHKISVEEVEAGIEHLMKWGKKTFKDHTGEWVEVGTSGQLHLFSDEIEPIAHSVEGL
jgi:hypothetical protein|tara:strand:- start:169 stop:369 length:201 start_codon:yes stop_codon:yes gene_type:complete